MSPALVPPAGAPAPRPSRVALRRNLTAILAGALHGPAEVLPVSSSAHVALVVRLVGTPAAGSARDAELAKAVEVAVHTGTLVGLTLGLRRDLLAETLEIPDHPRSSGRCVLFALVATVPAVVAGLGGERWIEERLGGPGAVAAGLLVGGAAMAAADRRADRRPGDAPSPSVDHGVADAGPVLGAPDPPAVASRSALGRPRHRATLADAVLVGLAQTTALWPGVSRSGATLTAARLRGFSRPGAFTLSVGMAIPAVVGATALKGVRLLHRARAGDLHRDAVVPLALATLASTASGLAAAPLARRARTNGVRLAPLAVYRAGLAAATLAARRAGRGV